MYDQFVAKDGRRGMDWTEVAVCIVQVGGRVVMGVWVGGWDRCGLLRRQTCHLCRLLRAAAGGRQQRPAAHC